MSQILDNVELITKQEAEAMLNDGLTAFAGDTVTPAVATALNAAKAYTDNSVAEVDADIASVVSDLQAEAVARSGADTNLQTALDAEAATREDIDNALRGDITREHADRIAAVAQVSDSVANEAALRIDADSVLQGKITQEIADRQTADTALDEKIDTEVLDRYDADGILDDKITAEITAREDAVSAVTDSIALEIQNRTESEAIINGRIDDLKATSNTSFEDTIFCARLDNLPIAQMTVENKDPSIAVGDIIGTVSAEYLPKIPVTFNFITNYSGDAGDYAYIVARLDANGNVIVINVTELAQGSYEGNIDSVTVTYITKD